MQAKARMLFFYKNSHRIVVGNFFDMFNDPIQDDFRIIVHLSYNDISQMLQKIYYNQKKKIIRIITHSYLAIHTYKINILKIINLYVITTAKYL